LVDGDIAPSEPELNVMPSRRGYPMAFLAYLSVVEPPFGGTTECNTDADCGQASVVCVDRQCQDTAAPCRPIEIVHVGSFLATDRGSWDRYQCSGAYNGILHPLWTQWMNTGVGCNEGELACWPGSTCVQRCDVWWEQDRCV